MTIRYQFTRHQVPRGTLPDAETNERIYLLKNVSLLRATYQIRLLAFQAEQSGKKLVLRVPKACKLSPDLRALRRACSVILVERV
jgi:hypothetical protein